MKSGEFRCPGCNRLLFIMQNLQITGGYIEIKCRCKTISVIQDVALDTNKK